MLIKPTPGSIRRLVYDNMGYNYGQSIADLAFATGLTKHQTSEALRGMKLLGLVERFENKREVLWCKVGATPSNDPTTVDSNPA